MKIFKTLVETLARKGRRNGFFYGGHADDMTLGE